MKKTWLNSIPEEMPQDLRQFVSGANFYDSSCSPEARVYFIDKGKGYYLKCSDRGRLAKEAKMTAYFYAKGIGAEVLHYASEDSDWLLTAAVVGQDCLHETYLSAPERLCDTIAYELRRLHETDAADCPVQDRTAEYLAGAEQNYRTGRYDKSCFPDSFADDTAAGTVQGETQSMGEPQCERAEIAKQLKKEA